MRRSLGALLLLLRLAWHQPALAWELEWIWLLDLQPRHLDHQDQLLALSPRPLRQVQVTSPQLFQQPALPPNLQEQDLYTSTSLSGTVYTYSHHIRHRKYTTQLHLSHLPPQCPTRTPPQHAPIATAHRPPPSHQHANFRVNKPNLHPYPDKRCSLRCSLMPRRPWSVLSFERVRRT
jgi:hypothetical protein